MAFHVSPDGQDLVAATTEGWILYIPNFRNQSDQLDSTVDGFRLYVASEVSYLQFDGRRILLSTVSYLSQDWSTT
jgi:hypothetical protein